jgi:hypothetical protein
MCANGLNLTGEGSPFRRERRACDSFVAASDLHRAAFRPTAALLPPRCLTQPFFFFLSSLAKKQLKKIAHKNSIPSVAFCSWAGLAACVLAVPLLEQSFEFLCFCNGFMFS